MRDDDKEAPASPNPESNAAAPSPPEPAAAGAETVETAASAPKPKSRSGLGLALAASVVVPVLILGAAGAGAWATRDQWLPLVTSAQDARLNGLAGQVDALSNRIDSLQSRHTASADAVSALAERVQALSSRADDLGAKVSALESALTEAPARAAPGASAAEMETLNRRVAALEKAQVPARDLAAAQAGLTSLSQSLTALQTRVTTLEQARNQNAQARRDDAALALALVQLHTALREAQPFPGQLALLHALTSQDPQAATLLAPLDAAAVQGVASLRSLRERFDALAPAILRAGRVPASGSWWQRALARIEGLVTIRRTGAPAEGGGVAAVTQRIQAALDAGDLAAAVAETRGLQGGAAQAAAPWLAQAQTRLAAEGALARLDALAVGRLSRTGP